MISSGRLLHYRILSSTALGRVGSGIARQSLRHILKLETQRVLVPLTSPEGIFGILSAVLRLS